MSGGRHLSPPMWCLVFFIGCIQFKVIYASSYVDGDTKVDNPLVSNIPSFSGKQRTKQKRKHVLHSHIACFGFVKFLLLFLVVKGCWLVGGDDVLLRRG